MGKSIHAPDATEFRARAVELARSSGVSKVQVARDLGINPETLRLWVRQAKFDSGQHDGPTVDEKAELARLRTLESRDEVDGLAAAYTDNLSALGGGARFFANPIAVTKLPTSQVRLRILEALADNAQWRAESVSNVEEKPVSSVDQTSTRLAKHAQIAEPEFTSPTAVLGPAIVAVRRFWNWMSTKWYVRQVIQQQNAFNAEVVATVSALEDRFAKLEEKLGGVGTLARDRVFALEDRFTKLEEKLATWEGMAIAAERSWVALNRDVALLETRLQRLEDRLGAIEEQLHNLADERRYRAVPDDQR
ncbi:MAG TPA: transposase [Chloroflexota bacterium]|nr:transposase [Chloroflexota bacterium]